MAQAEAPVQPLPPWMATTWLQVGPSSSTFVTLQYPQTYSGPSLPGLTWPWVYRPTDPAAGIAVSVIGGTAGLVTIPGEGALATSAVPTVPSGSRPFTILSPVPTSSPTFLPSTALSTEAFSTSSLADTTEVSRGSSASTLVPSPTISTSAITSSPTIASTSSLSSDPSQSAQSAGNSLSSGAIVGIVLASLVFFLLLLWLFFFCCQRRRRDKDHTAFTMLDPERQRMGTPASRNRSAMSHPAYATSALLAQPGTRGSSPHLGSASRQGCDSGENNALMAYRDEEARTSEDGDYMNAPPIMLQSPDSGESVRHCPSNNSLGTTNNTDSTKTRASLISQFPVYDRRPSDHSSQGHGDGGDGGAAGGGVAGPSGSRAADPEQGHNSGSGRSGTETGLFSAPPPRPPSRTRTVSTAIHAANIGLGRPLSSPRGPRSPRLFSLPETSMPSTSSSTPLMRSMSNRSSRSLLGAPVWLKGFTWLRPFFEPANEDQIAMSAELESKNNEDVDSAEAGDRPSGERLLPTAAPVMRQVPEYRRVTTTAAAFDVEDLRDLAQRRTGQTEDAPLSEEDSASDGEGSSFLEASHLRTPPTTASVGQQTSRWSRATLGQPIQRISGISSVSLSDIRSISESMTSSARARAKARSRSGSASESSHMLQPSQNSSRSPARSLSRASSRGTVASQNQSHSSRSRSGSGSEGGQLGIKTSSRRANNSSSGSNGSSGHGSHRSARSNRTALGRVTEDTEVVPPLPPKPSVYR